MANEAGRDVFLLLPRVLLKEGASIDGCGMGDLDLATIERLLERVLAERGGELSRTMLLIGGRPSLYETMLEQVSEESSPFLADLGLMV